MTSLPDPQAPGLPQGVIRRAPEDFIVDELPAYPASGRGEHVFITFRKTRLNTPDAIRTLARALGSDQRTAGHAGMKDRHAITTQTASFQLPLGVDPEPLLAAADLPGIEVLTVARHDHKLKPGHLLGNRFRIIVRDVSPDGITTAQRHLERASTSGVPNAFGPQRFGRDGANPERALGWVAGRWRGPRDRREQRLLLSSLQSRWFNEVLTAREADGTWTTALPGDLAKKHDSGGLFLVPLEGPELDDARERARAGALSATGPMFGKKMRWPEGAPLELERAVLARDLDDPHRLDAVAHAGEGTRRPLRMMVHGLETTVLADDERAIALTFVLPKGGYATTLLGRAFQLIDATAPPRASGDVEDPGQEEEVETDASST
ncbi:tRNA pseudouridine(13) synthase TruD [Chondromyces crocatus]|uniref:tRNA pseudouridine synthase D n=1 Tax=Chondromyces crocatus TaxID=52 RepID=A0A0K1EJM3_CHOCO|nr:tRNA pseudouridine(13) synthase TruD [Chondromyces crocatus]AKT40887.1 tRNA pseudouridine synthase D [Chondromyces crocatus]